MSESAHRPALRIVRGEPSAEEIAALVAVLSRASAGEGAAGAGEPQSHWAHPQRLLRTPVAPSGWWASNLPR